MAEKLWGNTIKHSFYAAKNPDRTAHLEDYVGDPALCIVLAAEMKDMHEQVHKVVVPGEALSITYTLSNSQETFSLPGNIINKALLMNVDGKTPISKMVGKVNILMATAVQK